MKKQNKNLKTQHANANQRIKTIKEKLNQLSKIIFSGAVKTISVVKHNATPLLLLTAVMVLPKLHIAYIRNYIGDSVVMLTNNIPGKSESYGGGTGFHITAQSGKTVVISNRHVCMAGKKQGFMYGTVRGRTGYHKLKIIELYSNADLCVLEPIKGVRPLKLGTEPTEGQSVWAVGHPNLQPRTVTKGEVQGFEWMMFAVGAIGYYDFSEEDCKFANRFLTSISKQKLGLSSVLNRTDKKLFTQEEGSGKSTITLCVERNLSMITTVNIYKGNSGSPVLDDFGNVVSVMFATNSDQMWGQAITHYDLKNLLEKY